MSVRLTEAFLDALEPPAKRLEILDAEVPTFGVRVSPNGAKSFFVLYTLRGERRKRRYTIGAYGKLAWRLTLPRDAPKGQLTARDEARRIIGLVAHGGDPQGERMGERGAILFEDFAARYLEEHAKRKKRSWEQDDGYIRRALLPAWKGRAATTIRKRDALEVINALARTSPISANRLRLLISRMFTWGAEQDLVEHNPTTGTKPPAEERAGERQLTPRELAIAYQRCTGAGPVGDVVRLLILTWQRRAEIACIELGELREGLTLLEIPGARMKNKRPHVVPLAAPARAIIAARLAVHPGGARLFVDKRGRAITPDDVTRFIGELAAGMGGAPFTQRDLRRTCTSIAGRLGFTQFDRGRVLSHTDTTVTGKHYDRYDYLPEKTRVLEAWASFVLAEVAKLRHGDTAEPGSEASSSSGGGTA